MSRRTAGTRRQSAMADSPPPEGADEEFEALQAEVAFLRDQLDSAVSREDYEAERERSDDLQARLDEAEARAEDLAAEREGADQDVSAANTRLVDLESKLGDARRDNDLYRSQLEQKDAEIARLGSELRGAQSRLSKAVADASRASQAGRASTRELTQHARENAQLKDEMRGLVEEVAVQRAAVADLQALLQSKAEVMEELERRLEEETQGQREAAAATGEAEAAFQDLAKMRDTETQQAAKLHAELRAELEDWQSQAEQARERARRAEAEAAALRDELRRVKSQTRVAELETEVSDARKDVDAAEAERDELAEELRAAHTDLAALGQRVAELQSKTEEVVEVAVGEEKARWAGADEELAALRRRLAEAREGSAALEEELRRSQAALEEARHRMGQYERRYGLEDAVRELDTLRDALTSTQEELDDVSRKLEDGQSRFMTLVEISRLLAAEAGHGEGVDVFDIYPEHKIRMEYATAVDRVRLDNGFLARRVEELEAERVELLRQLRINAQQVGTDSLRYFGLTGDQMTLVNEFAENLREGTVALPERDDSAALRRG
ncbi:hypothetical protein FNF29_05289 [Cafeteria roenbergensis]|uniref:Uncharacterized protein n=1 Tax=Cafeteria roenbergensis TaxID=33653 RepID=A0A5A8CBM9_CAFRO|nr:hypothetical protein FNF29_05289 [Cafeteria roenbergensis]|eukprot:KAA0150486.1 hypothetical protein FNF29_05289 [Cafeteria roenbergensis]